MKVYRAVTAIGGALVGVVVGAVVMVLGDGAAAQPVPLPHPRPAEVAPSGHGIDPPALRMPPTVTACQLRLSPGRAVFKPLGDMSGPSACGGPDIIELQRIVMADRGTVAVEPPATLRCEMAEAIVDLAQGGLAPAVASLGGALSAIENFDSYDCRGRNRVAGAKLSEHGRANALDIRALRLKDGRIVRPTDDAVPREFRLAMKTAVCTRFTTVLGPGSDGYHEDHVHVDLAERAGGHRMCQWDLHDTLHPDGSQEQAEVAALASPVPLPRARPFVSARVLRAHLPSAESRH
jgi:hypothetical protein